MEVQNIPKYCTHEKEMLGMYFIFLGPKGMEVGRPRANDAFVNSIKHRRMSLS